MLTVDYARLDLRAGDLLLDLGCGAGRHAFEAFRRGARVVACDHSFDELREVGALFAAMRDAGEAPVHGQAGAVRGDAVHLPSPDATFDRIIAAEVLEHIPDDVGALDELVRVLKPGGIIAVTIPAWLPETICWRLSDEYHAPKAEGGHVRIYTENEIRERLQAAGAEPGGSHHAHALHSPYWWLKCAVGPTNDDHPLVRA
jgi:ubiquinone/menaquinone biosynthesis C-methylase UbiE